jgi:hypothetical protein
MCNIHVLTSPWAMLSMEDICYKTLESPELLISPTAKNGLPKWIVLGTSLSQWEKHLIPQISHVPDMLSLSFLLDERSQSSRKTTSNRQNMLYCISTVTAYLRVINCNCWFSRKASNPHPSALPPQVTKGQWRTRQKSLQWFLSSWVTHDTPL